MTHHQSPNTLLMLTTLVMSTLLMLTSTNWIFMWLSMEMNLMSMIPLMNTSKLNYEIEGAIKYFMIQASSSALLLTSMTMIMSSFNMALSSILAMASLMMKLGMAPFHIWLPQVLNSMTWPMIIIIVTWQKIGPLAILSYTTMFWDPALLLLMVTLNAAVGSLSGINQTQMRPLIAYSSIAHMAWMLASSSLSMSITFIYFIFYFFLNIMLMAPLIFMAKLSTSEFTASTQISANLSLPTMISLLSLAGMPPLLGFIPKWLVIVMIIKMNFFMSIVLISSSLISLFFYLTIFFAVTLTPMKSFKFKTPTPHIFFMLPMNILPTIITLSLL